MTTLRFTTPRIEAAQCPADKAQCFLWDSAAPGLGLRVTPLTARNPKGSRAFIFQGRLGAQSIRITIGDARTWSLQTAQTEARRLQSLIDQGKDPREEKLAAQASAQAERTLRQMQDVKAKVTGLTAWSDYCQEREVRWSEHSQKDHASAVQEGGVARQRSRTPVTQVGPLRALLQTPLVRLDADAVRQWVKQETPKRPTVTAKQFRMLRAFINWCTEDSTYKDIVQADACKPKATRQLLHKPLPRSDALQKEQLPSWFEAVRRHANPVTAAYLQALLLTGARRDELLSLHWEDIDFRWKTLRIKDKVEGERTIPLTPHVERMLSGLPRLMDADGLPIPWVFSSTTSASGRLHEPRIAHNKALEAAGLPHLTLHGLRRSFGSLSEWIEVPVGVVAQIQGHKPSALIERHYRVRPIDLLRMWHTRIEDWILEQASGLQH